MSKKEKLKARLRNQPVDFSYRELRTLLIGLGYEEDQKGKTAGSRVIFYKPTTQHTLFLHKPHPTRIMKRYQIQYVKEELIKQGLL